MIWCLSRCLLAKNADHRPSPISSQSTGASWRPEPRAGCHNGPELEHSGASRLFALKQPQAPDTSLSKLRLRCQFAPHPTFPPAGFSDDTVSLGLKLSVASLAREGLFFFFSLSLGSWEAQTTESRRRGGSATESPVAVQSAPLTTPPSPPSSLSQEGDEPREGLVGGLVIACSGTMPTFEPLTTKQTTLVLLLHCPNRVY